MGEKLKIGIISVICIAIGVIAGSLGVYFSQPYRTKDLESRTTYCVLSSPGNSVTGTIKLTQISANDKIVITGNVTGLSVGKHGFHIHEFGILNDDCTSAAGHFNPYDVAHGGPTDDVKHVGDMGNIETLSVDQPTLIDERELDVSLYEPDFIIGRGLVIHEGEDDLTSQPTGDAGGRAACCTILYANPEYIK